MPSGVVEKGWQTFYHFIDFLTGWSFVKVWIWDVIVWGVWRAEGLCDTVCFRPKAKEVDFRGHVQVVSGYVDDNYLLIDDCFYYL